jgi:NAD(P)-dependent dehydrogenase (short-subunit alcohol dehydrogenase family)
VKIAITGVTSDIGIQVAREAKRQGHEVVRLVRHPGKDEIMFDLSQHFDPRSLDGVDAVIHLAWQWSPPGYEYRRTNVDGSRRLFDAALAKQVPVVLLSTFSAFTKDDSEYAKCKRALEYDLRDSPNVSVRAGLIWGSSLSGITKTISKIAKVKIICPHLAPDPLVYPSHAVSLARLLVSSATVYPNQPVLWAARPEAVRLSDVVHAVRQNSSGPHISFPIRLIKAAAAVGAALHVPLPIRPDSLDGGLRWGDVPVEQSGTPFAGDMPSNDEFLRWMFTAEMATHEVQ